MIQQLLLRKKAAEELKKEQERKAAERRRIIEERCGRAKDLESANEGMLKRFHLFFFHAYCVHCKQFQPIFRSKWICLIETNVIFI